MPEKFDLSFINEKGEKERPVIIHRAIMGSFDRFLAYLTEQTAGAFPMWLCPEQIWILPISEKHIKYAENIALKLRKENLRLRLCDETETLGKKIREGETQKIPYLIIVGDKETKNKNISVRQRGKGDLGAMSIAKFLKKIQAEIQNKK